MNTLEVIGYFDVRMCGSLLVQEVGRYAVDVSP
jgi:hypothetical protein